MPTPVTTARQCLTPEATQALDEAVKVAKRRGHGQTTSLHAISALLSLPSSPLRDACARASNSSYSSRLQFKALELCLSVALDRVPSSGQPGSSNQSSDPPVSNSLMAAIKRSQANQRRQPENFHFYQQQQSQLSSSSSSSMSCIKAALRNLILSILDDPVVSRVFGEAGFRSTEIKLAILRPIPHLFRVPRLKGPPPPMFLCNLEPGSDTVRDGFGLPFGRYTGLMGGEEGWRKIGEVLGRDKGRNRNPVLVGARALDVLERFCEVVDKRELSCFSPPEVSGLRLIRLGSEVRRFVSGRGEKGCLGLRFEEVGKLVSEESLCLGLVLHVGDLRVFINEEIEEEEVKEESLDYVVGGLAELLRLDGGKRVWVIGGAERHETYSKLVAKFPSIEKDWDLQLLPISSFRSSSTTTSESYPRSSLMESFVPFGGFFSTPSDFYGPLSTSYQRPPRCNGCNEKYEQEVLAASNGGVSRSVADQYQSCLPSWLQMTELGTNNGLDGKARDNGVLLSAKVAGLQKKWDDICWRLHHVEQPPGSNLYTSRFPTVMGFQLVEDKKEDGEPLVSNLDALQSANTCANADSCIPVDSQTISGKPSSLPFPVVSEVKTDSSKQWEISSKKEDFDSCSLRSPSIISSSSKGDANQASPTNVTSVTTDLGLGVNSMTNTTAMKTPVKLNQNQIERLLAPVNGSPDVDFVNGSVSEHLAQSSSSSSPDLGGYFDPSNFKKLFKALTERVGWQTEAIRDISQTIACCWNKNEKHEGASLRRGIWLHFLGPDRCRKRKIAAALAEIRCGSGENIFCADFDLQDHMYRSMPFDNQGINNCDVTSRGKTLVDYIARELRSKPSSVVFLENVDKADAPTQNTLSCAMRTGKFSDSHGREVGINDAIFVTTSTFLEDEILSSRKDFSSYSEDRILQAKGCPLQVLIEQVVGTSSSIFLNKRKLGNTNQNCSQPEVPEALKKRVHTTSPRILDLNLPAEENHVDGSEGGSSDSDSISDSSRAWLQEYLDQVDRIISFKAFDFDSLAKRILNEINEAFHKIVGSEPSLHIDIKVMEQLLAAAFLSETDRVVESWVDQVLSWGFVQAMKKHNLGSHSVVRLVTCDGCHVEEPNPGVYLPRKIIIN